MDKGCVGEFGHPDELLDSGGHFASLVAVRLDVSLVGVPALACALATVTRPAMLSYAHLVPCTSQESGPANASRLREAAAAAGVARRQKKVE